MLQFPNNSNITGNFRCYTIYVCMYVFIYDPSYKKRKERWNTFKTKKREENQTIKSKNHNLTSKNEILLFMASFLTAHMSIKLTLL